MLRALVISLSLSLLAGCMTSGYETSARSAKLRNAQAATTSVTLGTGY